MLSVLTLMQNRVSVFSQRDESLDFINLHIILVSISKNSNTIFNRSPFNVQFRITYFANILIINNEKVKWGYLYRTDYSSTFVFCFDEWTDCDFMRRFPGLYIGLAACMDLLPPSFSPPLPTTLIDTRNQLTCGPLAAFRYKHNI